MSKFFGLWSVLPVPNIQRSQAAESNNSEAEKKIVMKVWSDCDPL